jgi:hypothetical protein
MILMQCQRTEKGNLFQFFGDFQYYRTFKQLCLEAIINICHSEPQKMVFAIISFSIYDRRIFTRYNEPFLTLS